MQKTLIVVLIVVVVVLAGVIVWQNLGNKVLIESNLPQENGQAKLDETADWQVYKNEKYGFEVKYPATWQIPTERNFASYPESGVYDTFLIYFYKNTVNGQGINRDGFFISVSKRDDTEYRDLSAGVGLPLVSGFGTNDDFSKCSSPVSEVAIGIGNYSAKKVSVSSTDKCFQPVYRYVVQNGEYSYGIRSSSDGFACVGCNGESTTKEKFPEFYQILSTFKFTK